MSKKSNKNRFRKKISKTKMNNNNKIITIPKKMISTNKSKIFLKMIKDYLIGPYP